MDFYKQKRLLCALNYLSQLDFEHKLKLDQLRPVKAASPTTHDSRKTSQGHP